MKKTDTLSKPDINIFRDRKEFLLARTALREYLEKGGDKIALKDRMEVSLQLSRVEIEYNNLREAERLLSDCEEYIMTNGKEEEKACIYNIKGLMYATKAMFTEGITMALKSLSLFQQMDFPYFEMNCNVLCGHLCSRMNLHNEAIDYMTQAYEVAMRIGDIKQAALCTMNLNDIRMQVLPAKDCIKACKDLLEHSAEIYVQAGSNLQLAHLYFTAGKMKEAGLHAKRSMDLTLKLTHFPPHHLQYLNLYAVMSEIAGAQNDEAAVLENTRQNMERAVQANNVAAQIDARFFLFRFYLGRKNVPKAEAYLNEAGSMIDSEDRSTMYLHLNENKCLYYSTTGDLANELKCFRLIYDYKMKAQQEAIANRVKYMSTVYELELKKKEVMQQKSEIDFKTQELNMTTYHLNQRNQLLNDLKQNIEDLKKAKSKADVVFSTITKRIDQAFVKEEEEKIRFREKFDEAHRGFIAKLHLAYPDLSPTECRICALLRSGFNTKEISNLLSTSSRNIENHRVRIRAKLNLTREDNLNLILTEIK